MPRLLKSSCLRNLIHARPTKGDGNPGIPFPVCLNAHLVPSATIALASRPVVVFLIRLISPDLEKWGALKSMQSYVVTAEDF